MRSIVAIGLATFVAYGVAVQSWAGETSCCADSSCAKEKCCGEAKGAAGCPACPSKSECPKAECSQGECSTSVGSKAECTSAQCEKSQCATSGCAKSTCQAGSGKCEASCTVAGKCEQAQCEATTCATAACAKAECEKSTCSKSGCDKCACAKEACNQTKAAQGATCEPAAVTAEPAEWAIDATTSTAAVRPAIATVQAAPCGRSPVYTVEVRRVEGDATQPERELAAPRVRVGEGTAASVGSHTSRPFVTGIRKNRDGVVEPIITVLDEGTKLEVRVTSLGNRRVQLDATVESTTIEGTEAVESPFQTTEELETLQAPTVSTQSRRVVRAVALGEKVEIRCGCTCCTNGNHGSVVLLTVDEVGAPTPGITPITKVSAATEIRETEIYQVVYPVGDLMQPYAVHKEGAAVEAADFLPVIDMLLTESGCDWPAAAQIRPFEENQSVVISQTQAGHEAIAKYLAAKRAAVAEIEAHLPRK